MNHTITEKCNIMEHYNVILQLFCHFTLYLLVSIATKSIWQTNKMFILSIWIYKVTMDIQKCADWCCLNMVYITVKVWIMLLFWQFTTSCLEGCRGNQLVNYQVAPYQILFLYAWIIFPESFRSLWQSARFGHFSAHSYWTNIIYQ